MGAKDTFGQRCLPSSWILFDTASGRVGARNVPRMFPNSLRLVVLQAPLVGAVLCGLRVLRVPGGLLLPLGPAHRPPTCGPLRVLSAQLLSSPGAELRTSRQLPGNPKRGPRVHASGFSHPGIPSEPISKNRHRLRSPEVAQRIGVICWNTISHSPPRFSTTHVTRVRTTPPLDGRPGGRNAYPVSVTS